MRKFSACIYIPAKKMMLFKVQTSVEMLLKVYKVPSSQKARKALTDRLICQQHCDFLFAFITTWCIKSHLPETEAVAMSLFL